MIPGAFLLCANPRCSGVTWEAGWPQEPDVPRTTTLTHGELTFRHTGDRSEKKEPFKKHKSYLYTLLQDFWELQSKLENIQGGEKGRKQLSESSFLSSFQSIPPMAIILNGMPNKWHENENTVSTISP